jgi:Resolvase, N terminal domain
LPDHLRAGCEKIYTERASGAREDRPELARVLADVLRPGDTLVVWKLDRLARSLKTLIATAEDLLGKPSELQQFRSPALPSDRVQDASRCTTSTGGSRESRNKPDR